MLGIGITGVMAREIFKLQPERDKNTVMQGMYDEGYSVREISKATGVGTSAIYDRINAYRGRGPGTAGNAA